MKEYWFALKSHIYVDFKEKNMLLYDTRCGNRIESTVDETIALIRQMYEPVNLGVVPIDGNMLSEPRVGEFVETVIHKNMGDLIDVEKCPVKPVRLVPILNLQKDIEKYKDDENKMAFFERDLGKYLLELNLYVNSTCDEACGHCGSFCKQVRCCTANGHKEELSFDSLERLFEQIRYLPINSINILGGDISKYTHLNELKQLAVSYSKELRYYCHYKNSAIIETFLLVAGEAYDLYRITLAINKMEEWYVGDGWYSDGAHFAFDYYSSYVIHPMYVECHSFWTSEAELWTSQKIWSGADIGVDRKFI